ncbi:hypothetical protein K3725_22405 (plasmid) [Leisingera sp. S132]|uniref:hypothetical protein n=1 Tax=Leisingera sp. S132 TaxID=2867016 RepID=UPI0021A97095|nr:hypothetical protein [Leisingera sp. S132]UWQ81874.1 hypothetical protein K3725_22405 [Leisingera sp. S132]
MSLLEAPGASRTAGPAAGPVSGGRARTLLRGALAGLAAALLLAGLFGRLMAYGLRRDETLYVPPAALLPELQLYRDIFYNHVPDSAWLFWGFHQLSGGFGLLGSARLAVFCAWLLLLSGAAWAGWRLGRSRALALLLPLMLITCTPLLTQAGMSATNNLLPLPFALWGLGLFVQETLKPEPGRAGLLLAGLCLSLAAGMKASAVVFIPPAAIGAFFLPAALPLRRRLRQVVLPLYGGGILGALPLFWYLLRDPASFLAHVAGFHTGPHKAYWLDHAASEPGLALGLGARLQLAQETWLSGSALVLALLLACCLWAAPRGSTRRTPPQGGGQILVLGAALVLAAAMSLLPAPGFVQYYIPPLAVLVLLAALLWRRLEAPVQAGLLPLLGGAALVCLALGAPRLGDGLAALARPGEFTAARVARGGAALRQALARAGAAAGPVATFMPVYPLEAGLPVYAEFATGQFAYRISPYLKEELRRHYRMAGPQDLEALFAADPPAALLLGYAPELEKPLLAYALARGCRRIPAGERPEEGQQEGPGDLASRYGTGQLFLCPPAKQP